MNKDAIVFACANPVPEIWPWEALEAGAVVGCHRAIGLPQPGEQFTGFPRHLPRHTRCARQAHHDEMCLAAAHALADMASAKGLNPDYILPNMDEWDVFPREAAAVAAKAVEQGIARISITYEEEYVGCRGCFCGLGDRGARRRDRLAGARRTAGR